MHCKSPPSKLAVAGFLIGVAACGGGQQSRPTTPYSPLTSQSSSDPYGSTLSQRNTNQGSGNAASSTPSSQSISKSKTKESTMNEQVAVVEEIIRVMDDAWSKNDVEGIVALFAQDATLESPLVPRLLNRKEGVCRGREEIRELVRALMQRGRPWGGHEPPIIQGNRVAIEFRRPSADGEQLYSVDIIEVVDGKIQSLRAYTGWRAVTG